MNRSVIAGAVALYLIGAVLHLEVLQHESGMIWGDAGDGFFNLWVMNHVTDTLSRGDWRIADGRIFWPDHADTLFWSDNLIAFAPLFAVGKWIMSARFDAFWLTGLFLSILHFTSLLFLFYQAFALVRDRTPDTLPHGAWLIPVFAYLAHFSPAVLTNHFAHMQNLATLWLFVLIGGMLGYWRKPAARWLCVMGAALVLALFTAPYYALAAALLLMVWAGLEGFARGRELGRHVWHARVALAALFVPAVILAVIYYRVERVPYLPSDVKTFAIGWSQLFMPAHGAMHELLAAVFGDGPAFDHEKVAWLGPGLLAGLLWMIAHASRHSFRPSRALLRKPIFWILALSLLLFQLKVRELRPALSWYGPFFILSTVVAAMYLLAQRFKNHPLPRAMGYVAIAVVLMYGMAFGPHGYYMNQHPNPSIWGFLSLWVPGFTSMRAVGRMAFVGQVLLMLLLALWWWRLSARAYPSGRRLFPAGMAAVCMLQALDAAPVRAPQRLYDESYVQPTAEEAAYFGSIRGSLTALPATPFARNTVPMLYFSPFPELRLLNGYSGKSTDVWDRIMRLEFEYGPGSAELASYIANQGADYIAYRADALQAASRHRVREMYAEPRFANERWWVYAAGDMRESP